MEEYDMDMDDVYVEGTELQGNEDMDTQVVNEGSKSKSNKELNSKSATCPQRLSLAQRSGSVAKQCLGDLGRSPKGVSNKQNWKSK